MLDGSIVVTHGGVDEAHVREDFGRVANLLYSRMNRLVSEGGGFEEFALT